MVYIVWWLLFTSLVCAERNFIAVDLNSPCGLDALNNAPNLFSYSSSILPVNNVTTLMMHEAFDEMKILFLPCGMPYNDFFASKVRDYVYNGGTLLYTSNSNAFESLGMENWEDKQIFNTTRRNVTLDQDYASPTMSTSKSIVKSIHNIFKGSSLVVKPTESTKIQISVMETSVVNQNNCILFNNPLSTKSRSYDESGLCWLFKFPYGTGFVLEMAIASSPSSVWSLYSTYLPLEKRRISYYLTAFSASKSFVVKGIEPKMPTESLGGSGNPSQSPNESGGSGDSGTITMTILSQSPNGSSGSGGSGGPSQSPNGSSGSGGSAGSAGSGSSQSPNGSGGGSPQSPNSGGSSQSSNGAPAPPGSTPPQTIPAGGSLLPPIPQSIGSNGNNVTPSVQSTRQSSGNIQSNQGNPSGVQTMQTPNGANGASVVPQQEGNNNPPPPGSTNDGGNSAPAAPTSAAGVGNSCSSCSTGEVQQQIGNQPNSGPEQVSVQTTQGQQVGQVFVPQELAASAGGSLLLDIQFVQANFEDVLPDRFDVKNGKLGGSIMDISLTDDFGNSITSLSSPMTICIDEESDEEDVCLGFFNILENEWECEDKNPKKTGNTYCGETDHLTSFALLLDATGSSGEEYIFVWLSVAMIGASIICILIAIVLIEIRYNLRSRKRTRILQMISNLQESDNLPTLNSGRSSQI